MSKKAGDRWSDGGDADGWLDGLYVADQEAPPVWSSGLSSERRLYIAESQGWSVAVRDDGVFLADGAPVYPAKRVFDWALWATGNSHLVKHKGLLGCLPAIVEAAGPGAMMRPLVVPEYWRQSEKRLRTWWLRTARWFYTAQCLVWSVEMMRLHTPALRHVPAPSWWRKHAVAWAIGVPSAEQQVARLVYSDPCGPTGNVTEPDLKTDMSPVEWERVARLAMQHTPVPGTAGAMGEQILPYYYGHKLALCDIPDGAGSMAMPVELVDNDGEPWWSQWVLYHAVQKAGDFTWAFDVVKPICDAIASVAMGAAGGVTSAAAQAATTIADRLIMTAATVVIQAIGRMSRGGKPFNMGDIVGLVGDAVDLGGLVEGFDVSTLPAGTWEALKTAGAEIPQISGSDWTEMSPVLKSIQNKMVELRDDFGWNYLDQAFGGLGLSEKAQSLKDFVNSMGN